MVDWRIGEHLKTARKKAGLTQREVAIQLGLNRKNTISDWETNTSVPDLQYVLQLVLLYDVTADELLGVETMKKCEKI